MGVVNRFKKEVLSRLSVTENKRCRELCENYSIGGKYKRIYFYHIRKCGGTSINRMFLSVGGESSTEVQGRINKSYINRTITANYVLVGPNKMLIDRGAYFYAYSHWPMHELDLPKNTFTFTCLRDPIERIISHYRMIMDYKIFGKYSGGMESESKWFDREFGDFIENIPREHLLNQIYMFSRNFDQDEAFENIQNCSHFFLLEQFSQGIAELADRTALSLAPIHIRKSEYDEAIPATEMERLHDMLLPEIQLYDRLKKAKVTSGSG